MNQEELAELGSTGDKHTVPTLRSTVQNTADYEDYTVLPKGTWPPPMYIKKDVSSDERYYMEHRWHSQWTFFDKKATENKSLYLRYQWIIGVGSVAVPVLVGINPIDILARDVLYFLTVAISLSVAISAAIENIYKYGDNWRSYRQAAEELKQEKSLYDVRAGRYGNAPQPFISFVERCEEICAQQNGRWVQSVEKQQTQSAEQVADILENYNKSEANTPQGLATAYSTYNSSSFQTQSQGLYDDGNGIPHQNGGIAPPTKVAAVLGAVDNAVAGYDMANQNVSAGYMVQHEIPNDMAQYDVPIGDMAQGDMAQYDVPMGDITQYDVPMGDMAQYDVPMGDITQYDVPIDEENIDIG